MRGICSDLFSAGQVNWLKYYLNIIFKETINSTLGFIILYLILDQKIQRKLHAELDNLTEKCDREIINQDRSKLPYTNAIINVIFI